jgi:RecA-family ATPase
MDSVPEPPKIQSIVDCVNNAGEPKKFLLPDMIKEGGLSIFAGREGAGKTLLGHQAAIELARGYGNFVAEGISPQNVIIIDGEMDDEDYVERFGNMDIPSNITRISETDFDNLDQLSEYIKGIVGGLLSPATIFIDNLVALSLENLTGKAVNKFFRDLKKIQRTSDHTITFVVVDHIGKTPEGHTLDNSLLAGSANIARFAHNILC